MVSATQRAEGPRPGRGRGRRGRRGRDRGRWRRAGRGATTSPRGRHRRARRDRPAARGDLRPGGADRPRQVARRGDRARRTRPASASAPTSTRGLDDRGPLHARDQGRHGVVQRPPDRQRRRAVRRLQAVGPGPRARPRGPGGLPGDEARPHRDRDRPEGVVVSVWRYRRFRNERQAKRRVATTSRLPRRNGTRLRNYVGGAWVPAPSGETLDDVNPATGEVTALVPLSGAGGRRRARSAAARAAQPGWRAVAPQRRARAVMALREALWANREELARLVTEDMGKTLDDARRRGAAAGSSRPRRPARSPT